MYACWKAVAAQIRAEYHLDQPFIVQYFIYLKNALTLNFGDTFAGQPVLDEKNYRAFQMLNASGLNLGAFCLPVVQTFMGTSAGLPIIMLDIGNATVATAGSLTITRTLLHMDENFKSLPLILRMRNIARDFLSSISFDIYMLLIFL